MNTHAPDILFSLQKSATGCTPLQGYRGKQTIFSGMFRRTMTALSVVVLAGAFIQPAASHAQTVSYLSISGTPTVSIGGTTQLTATATYSTGSTANVTDNVTWSSADSRLIGVSSAGLASGKATATVSITATYQGKTTSAGITSSVGDISWSAPLTITKGGTYTGNWKSTSSTVPAVTIATTDPVIIENSYVTGPYDLIEDATKGNNVTIKNVIGIGQLPNVKGKTYGVFVSAQNPASLTVENCYFESVRFGVWVRGYVGNRNGTQTITILNNRGHNINGAESNGSGGTLTGETNWQWAHAVQISNVNAVPGMVIAWNEIVNYPGQSLVNEIISMYDSSGTASSPVLVHDNYIQGGYPYIPATDNYNGGGFTTDGYSGDTVATATAFNNIYNNQFVGTTNMGVEIGTGHDNSAYNNRVISSGLLANGQKISAQNVGLTLYDVRGNVARGTMYNNNMYGNVVGWMCWASRCAWDSYRNDSYFPLNNADYSNQDPLPSGAVTLATEQNEYTIWLSKLTSDSKVVGPTVGSSGSGSGGGSGSGSGGSTISTTAWYSIVNQESSLCLDALSSGTANNTKVVQDTCNSSSTSQQWQFQSAGSGYYQLVNHNALATKGTTMVWDVTGGTWATGNSIGIQLYVAKSETNEEWMPVAMTSTTWKFIAHNSSLCLDVPSGSSVVNTQLQQYTCNGTGAQSYSLHQK